MNKQPVFLFLLVIASLVLAGCSGVNPISFEGLRPSVGFIIQKKRGIEYATAFNL